MTDLPAVIEAHWATWADHGGPVVDRLLFATDQAGEVAAIVSRWCATHLGAPVAAARRWTTSVGSVAVVDLADGRTVAVKVHQPDRDERFLTAVQDVQRAVAAAGVAAPRPLAEPAPIGTTGALATADSYLPDPGLTDGRAPGAMEVGAGALAVSIDAATSVDLRGLLLPHRTPTGRLWPTPHSPIFDFEATAAGAGWIDDMAREGLGARDAGGTEPTVVAHCDWVTRNVRVIDGSVAAAYDWDAVSLIPASTAVGQNAALWPCTGEPDSPRASTPAEVRAFVDAYDATAARPLDGQARQRAGASALYVLAYSARCEHAIGRHSGTGITALRTHGDTYLRALD